MTSSNWSTNVLLSAGLKKGLFPTKNKKKHSSYAIFIPRYITIQDKKVYYTNSYCLSSIVFPQEKFVRANPKNFYLSTDFNAKLATHIIQLYNHKNIFQETTAIENFLKTGKLNPGLYSDKTEKINLINMGFNPDGLNICSSVQKQSNNENLKELKTFPNTDNKLYLINNDTENKITEINKKNIRFDITNRDGWTLIQVINYLASNPSNINVITEVVEEEVRNCYTKTTNPNYIENWFKFFKAFVNKISLVENDNKKAKENIDKNQINNFDINQSLVNNLDKQEAYNNVLFITLGFCLAITFELTTRHSFVLENNKLVRANAIDLYIRFICNYEPLLICEDKIDRFNTKNYLQFCIGASSKYIGLMLLINPIHALKLYSMLAGYRKIYLFYLLTIAITFKINFYEFIIYFDIFDYSIVLVIFFHYTIYQSELPDKPTIANRFSQTTDVTLY